MGRSTKAYSTEGTRHGGLFYRRDTARVPILPKGRSKRTGLLLESQTFIRVPQTGAAIKTEGTRHGCHINRRDADTQPPNTHVRAVSSKYRMGRGCSSNPRPSLGSRRPEQQLKPMGRGTDAILAEGTRHEGLFHRRDAARRPILPNGHGHPSIQLQHSRLAE
jgi:hypothetical protein